MASCTSASRTSRFESGSTPDPPSPASSATRCRTTASSVTRCVRALTCHRNDWRVLSSLSIANTQSVVTHRGECVCVAARTCRAMLPFHMSGKHSGPHEKPRFWNDHPLQRYHHRPPARLAGLPRYRVCRLSDAPGQGRFCSADVPRPHWAVSLAFSTRVSE